ncbi:MAG TPA: hypothetical protein VGY98_07325 [Verrucomicrobiae bacterium]|nr:hypothetical protein [Verrucomicrobiae bacterium]
MQLGEGNLQHARAARGGNFNLTLKKEIKSGETARAVRGMLSAKGTLAKIFPV